MLSLVLQVRYMCLFCSTRTASINLVTRGISSYEQLKRCGLVASVVRVLPPNGWPTSFSHNMIRSTVRITYEVLFCHLASRVCNRPALPVSARLSVPLPLKKLDSLITRDSREHPFGHLVELLSQVHYSGDEESTPHMW